MAQEELIISSKASISYSLTLGNTITAPGNYLDTLTLKQGDDVKLTEDKNIYLLTLKGVKVIKKIYQPTEIEADLDFIQLVSIKSDSTENQAPTFKAVTGLLLQRQVELRIIIDNNPVNTFTVAKRCYVYELHPQLKADVKGTRMSVKMHIFSMDKLMTLNKYSKAYVASSLGSIITQERYGFGMDDGGFNPLVRTEVLSQIHLVYDSRGIKERIQPYLVQYNESFYDFLVRTSNRCGEFLFFEDGELTLGLPLAKDEITNETNTDETNTNKAKTDSNGTQGLASMEGPFSLRTPVGDTKTVKKEPVTIKDFESVVIQNVAYDPLIINDYVRDSMKDGNQVGELNHSVIDRLDNGFPKDAFTEELSGNAELSNDEYNFPLVNNKFSSLKREAYYDKPIFKVMNSLKAITTGSDIVGSVIGLGVAEGLLAMGGNSQAGNTNIAMQKTNIEPYTGKEGQVLGGGDSFSVAQFSTIDDKGWITNKFYNEIRQNEIELGRQIICIEMGTTYAKVKLGQKIHLKELDGNYIVTEIQTASEEYANDDAGQRRQTIYAIPSVEKDGKETYYPPVQPVPVIRKSGPQTAFVTDNNDPKYQGRVRVAFPWQSLKKGLKNQLDEASQSLNQTKNKKKELTTGMRSMKLKVWNAIERLYELIDYVKASPAERERLLAAKKAEISAIEKNIEKLEREKKTKEATKIMPLKDSSEPDPRFEAKERGIKELELKIKSKEEELAKKKEELAEMEAAAKEYDGRTDTKDYVVENDNTVVKAKWKKTEKLYYDEYEASHEQVKELQKNQDTQEKQQEKIMKVLEKDLLDNSTPWIRVATPMATPGGGTYFKPQVGDEVLINFDNDNVERPYVVGSLYSKNNLEPAESLSAKGRPIFSSVPAGRCRCRSCRPTATTSPSAIRKTAISSSIT